MDGKESRFSLYLDDSEIFEEPPGSQVVQIILHLG